MHGGVGWQGIIPSRREDGSISVDKGIAKLGSPSEFYNQLEPDRIAEHILDTARGDMREVVERIMEREHPGLWRDLPPRLRETVPRARPGAAPRHRSRGTDAIGNHTDQILDIKLMVIRYFDENPEMANRIFQEIGHKEPRASSPTSASSSASCARDPGRVHHERGRLLVVLPILGVLVGYITNLVAIHMIFQPDRAAELLGVKLQASS